MLATPAGANDYLMTVVHKAVRYTPHGLSTKRACMWKIYTKRIGQFNGVWWWGGGKRTEMRPIDYDKNYKSVYTLKLIPFANFNLVM